MTWHLVAVANAITAAAYFAIFFAILNGLRRTHQLGENTLGFATGLIFLTCAVHHGSHTVMMLLPTLGITDQAAYDMRDAWHWQNVVWDFFTAAVGVWYLSLRGSYQSVLRGAAMFEDLKVRERQALEINDSIVQGLTVAKYALDTGKSEASREAVEDTLRKAQTLISDMLGGGRSPIELQPGELHRDRPAAVGEDPDRG
jgi:hypothetical protein